MRKQYKQLTLSEREKIAVWKAMGKSLREMARRLGRSHSSIARELKRNKIHLFNSRQVYWPTKAHQKAITTKSNAAKRFRLKDPRIRRYVKTKLRQFWSPEQIASRIKLDHPNLTISHEAIYQYVYYQAWHLFIFLPRKHKRKRLRFRYSKPAPTPIASRTLIDQRPHEINHRLSFGHWESDSAVSKANTQSLHVLVERKCRVLKISKIKRNASRCVSRAIQRQLKPLPPAARRSLTYDNGFENRLHLNINRRLNMTSYFCHPYHSWEKGTVENTIGLIRRFFPKKTNFANVSIRKIKHVENLINNRPRKCLNYQTPNEVFLSLCGALPS